MNAINGATNSIFDALLTPLEAVGQGFAVYLVSGLFGVLALVVFKRISWQAGIKATKGKIKGHMIEIRLYQDDLVLVSQAICKVLLYNLKYLALNFGPFLPLALPFVLVAAQLVTRYAFDPVPVHTDGLPGQGVELVVEFDAAHKAKAGELEVVLPEGVEAASPLVRIPGQGRAVMELAPRAEGVHEIVLRAGGDEVVKLLHVGDSGRGRQMQGDRFTALLDLALWPAEDSLAGTVFERVGVQSYPERDLGWFPMGGPLGVLVAFVVASMVFGIVAIKPLGVQI